MNLLGAILYDPSSAATKACTSNIAMTAFDTTNLRLTVTVPAHGYIRVKMSCAIEGAATYPQIVLGMLVSSTVVGRISPQITINGTALSTTRAVASAEYVVNGLTPGSTVFDAAYGVEFLVAASNIRYGGPNDTTASNAWGGFQFEIWDPRPLPTAVAGAAGGLQIAGSNAATTYASLTSTGAFSINGVNHTSQTGDNFARLGAPAGASVSADVAAIQADTDNIQTRIPAALVSGRMDSSVGAMAANVLTATAINADAITAAKVADGTIDAATFAAGAINAAAIAADAITDAKVAADVTIASVTGAVGSVTGAVGSVTGNVGGNVTGSVGSVTTGGITSGSFAAGAINAAAIAADAIGASELAADAVTEIQSGLATAASLSTVAGYIDTEIADIQSRLPAALVSGRMDASVGAMAANVLTATAINADAITDAKVASDVTIASVTGAVGSVTGAVGSVTGNVGGNVAGSVGSVTGLTASNLDAAVSTRLATAGYTAPDNADILLIKAKTDNLPSDPADASDIVGAFSVVNANISALNNLSSAQAQTAATAALNAYDPPTRAEATTDKDSIITEVNANETKIDTLQTSVDAVPTNAELATALGTADDAVLTQVAAIKAKTDSLTFTAAGEVDANIHSVNDAAVGGTGETGTEWGPA